MKIIDLLKSEKAERNRQLIESWTKRKQNMQVEQVVPNPIAEQGLDRKLSITYVMNHVQVCGGAKIIFEHANKLVERGHNVQILCHFPPPNWIEVKAHYIQVPWHMNYTEAIPETDLIVCTVIDQVAECFLSQKAPVIHFEQGDVFIYEFEKYPQETREKIKQFWSFPVPLLAVSSGLGAKIEKHFGRSVQVLHNALNPQYFYPRIAGSNTNHTKPRILFVGPEQAEFKGIKDIFAALKIVRENGFDFEPVWVTQYQPQIPFEGTLMVNPSQEELGNIYRSCDIYVSGSLYESFPLPPLEAMTCGCAVVSTDNIGILEYAEHNTNCLLGEKSNPESLAKHIMYLLENPQERLRLVEGGYKTASEFSWEAIITKLEGYFYSLVENVELSNIPSLRVETLPKNLSREESIAHINQIHQTMSEDWCLWLVEGEVIDSRAIDQIKRILAHPIRESYSLRVEYPNDIPDHPIVRKENRLFPKGFMFNNDLPLELTLPITIVGGNEPYFLASWLDHVRNLYHKKKYAEMITVIQACYSSLSVTEKPVAVKWLVLALIEMQRFVQALDVLNDAMLEYPTFSDLYYLYLRVSLLLNQVNNIKEVYELINTIGDSVSYIEAFKAISDQSRLYV
jgi:L-malate glycosyltransferase